MPTWVYNLAGAGGIEKLEVANGGMAGKLAPASNAVQVNDGVPAVKRVTYSPAGADFVGSYTTGLGHRTVTWNWTIVAVSEYALYDIQAVIARYSSSHKAFELSDAYRATVHAILHSARPLSPYQALLGGRWRRVWMLEFHVLAPRNGGAFL